MWFQILETAFKKETVGLVTREQYVEKVIDRPFMYISLSLSIPGQSKFWLLNFHPLPEQRVNIRTKIEEEEKEKLQKLQQEWVWNPSLAESETYFNFFRYANISVVLLVSEKKNCKCRKGKRGEWGEIHACRSMMTLGTEVTRMSLRTVWCSNLFILFTHVLLTLLVWLFFSIIHRFSLYNQVLCYLSYWLWISLVWLFIYFCDQDCCLQFGYRISFFLSYASTPETL